MAIVPLTALLAYSTPPMEPFPWRFWAAMMAVAIAQSVATEWMFVSQIALFARVSDPAIGGAHALRAPRACEPGPSTPLSTHPTPGTYMSFLNTMANLGQKLPPTATFFLVDYLTCRDDSCAVKMDGFYVMTAVCTVVGIVWYAVAFGPVQRM